MEPYLGKYFSVEYVRKQVLHFTDEEIEEWIFKLRKKKTGNYSRSNGDDG